MRYITGEFRELTDGATKQTYLLIYDYALSTILPTLSHDIKSLFLDSNSIIDVWTKLSNKYDKVNATHVVTLEKKLYDLMFNQGYKNHRYNHSVQQGKNSKGKKN